MSILNRVFVSATAALTFSADVPPADASIAPLNAVKAMEAQSISPKQAYTAVFDSAASVENFKKFAEGAEVPVLEFIKDALEQAYELGITAQSNLQEPTIFNMSEIEIPQDIATSGGCAKFILERIGGQKTETIAGKVCTQPDLGSTVFSFE